MPVGEKIYPYTAFRFRIEIDGIISAHFSDVSGLQAETETESIEEGGVNDYVHYFPRRTKYQHLILKRGLTDSDELWKWYQDVVSGRFKRKNGSIILIDSAGNDKWRWNFVQAYPVKWTGPELKAETSSIAFESIEIVHHGIRKS